MSALSAVESYRLNIRAAGVRMSVWVGNFGSFAVFPSVHRMQGVHDEGAGGRKDNIAAKIEQNVSLLVSWFN